MTCRSCGSADLPPLLHLGEQPLAGHFPTPEEAAAGVVRWPLRLAVCRNCWLAQLDDAAPEEPPESRPIVEPVSSTMRAHLDAWADEIAGRLGRKAADYLVVELASHAGSLHRQLGERGIQSTVLDADARRVRALKRAGIPAARLGGRVGQPRLIVDQYLLAHVREPVALLARLRALAGPETELVLECEYLPPVLLAGRFDSMRHGHFSYFSFTSVEAALQTAGWRVMDASRQPVFGGTLRVWAQPTEVGRDTRGGRRPRGASASVTQIRVQENAAGLRSETPYLEFAARTSRIRRALMDALRAEQAAGRRIAAYGAPTRGNTLLNSCGIGTDLIEFTVDADPAKHGLLLPGSNIPIRPVDELSRRKVDTVLVLAWDLAGEIVPRLPKVRVIVPQPTLRVLSSAD